MSKLGRPINPMIARVMGTGYGSDSDSEEILGGLLSAGKLSRRSSGSKKSVRKPRKPKNQEMKNDDLVERIIGGSKCECGGSGKRRVKSAARVASSKKAAAQNPWVIFLKKFRKQHPNLSVPQAAKQAGVEYRKLKGSGARAGARAGSKVSRKKAPKKKAAKKAPKKAAVKRRSSRSSAGIAQLIKHFTS